MKTTNDRILKLIDVLKYQKSINTIIEFCEEIGMQRQTIYKIKKEETSFTVTQINTICKKYHVNANWIFGIQKNVFLLENSVEM